MTAIAELQERVKANRELPPPAIRRALREAAGVSLEDVARAVGVTRQAVALWEQGARHPSARHLVPYVEVLRVLGGLTITTHEMRVPAFAGNEKGTREEKNREATYHTPAAA